jgi:hypothetical protein
VRYGGGKIRRALVGCFTPISAGGANATTVMAHQYVPEGDHGNKIPERFEKHMVPFFSERLAFE